MIALYIFYDLPAGSDSTSIDYDTLALVLSSILCLFPILIFRKDGFKAFFRADVLVTTSVVYWALLDLIQDRYELYLIEAISIRYAFVIITVFVLAVYLFSQYSFKLPDIANEAAKSEIAPRVLFLVLISAFLIGIFPFWKGAYYDFEYMLQGLLRPRFAAPWARGVSGGFNAIIEHLKYFGYLLPSITALIISRDRKLTGRVIISILLTLFFSAFEFQGGGRRIIGFLIGSGAITYMVANKNRLKWKHFIVLSLIGAATLILLDMQLAFRNRGYQNMFEEYNVESLEKIKVDDNFYRIAQAIEFIPETHPFAGMQYLVWAFGRPVPRYFWSSKPMGPGFDMAAMAGEVGVSLSMTVIGEAYASYGIIMVILIGAFYGVLCGTINKLLYRQTGTVGHALYALGMMALVAGVRSLADLIVFSYAFFGLLLIYYLYLSSKVEYKVEFA